MVNNDGFDDDDAGCIDKDHDCQCTVAVCHPQSPHCIRVWLVSTGHCTVPGTCQRRHTHQQMALQHQNIVGTIQQIVFQ